MGNPQEDTKVAKTTSYSGREIEIEEERIGTEQNPT
jgi:hypothetical protein